MENDSFLEDLGLEPADQEVEIMPLNVQRHITRRSCSALPMQNCSEQEALKVLIADQRKKEKASTPSSSTKSTKRRSDETGIRRLDPKSSFLSGRTKSEGARNRETEEKVKTTERKLTNLGNVVQTETVKPETRDRPRWSAGSNKDSSRFSDASSKENSRPSDSSRESGTQMDSTRERNRGSGDANIRRSDGSDKLQVAMLNSVKEIVSTYTKCETKKILRAMQEFYIQTQANMIKLTLEQTEEIANDTRNAINIGESPSSSSFDVKRLVEENARLNHELAQAISRNQALRQDNEQIRNEIFQLKLRSKEFVP